MREGMSMTANVRDYRRGTGTDIIVLWSKKEPWLMS